MTIEAGSSHSTELIDQKGIDSLKKALTTEPFPYNPLEVAMYLNLKVYQSFLKKIPNSNGLLGFFRRENNVSYIYIEETLPISQKREVVARGIFRHFLSPQKNNLLSDIYQHADNTPIPTPEEYLCDTFAKDFLMPQEEFIKIYNRFQGVKNPFTSIAQHFNVEEYYAQERIKDLNLE